jgi:hypothetical protein
MHVYHGGLQFARCRYFNTVNERPGLPKGVAALVEGLAEDNATVTLVNADLLAAHEQIVQAGVFGEHDFIGAEVIGVDGGTIALSGL